MEPISSTDLLLYKILANPEKTVAPDKVEDLLQLRRDSNGTSPRMSPFVESVSRYANHMQGSPSIYGNRDSPQWSNDSYAASPTQEYRHNLTPPDLAAEYNSPSSGQVFDSFVQNEYRRLNPSSSSSAGPLQSHEAPRSARREEWLSPHGPSSPNQRTEAHERGGTLDFTGGSHQIPRGLPSSYDARPISSYPHELLDQQTYSGSQEHGIRPRRSDEPNYASDQQESSRATKQLLISELRAFAQETGLPLGVKLDEDTPVSALRTELDLIHETRNSMQTIEQMRKGAFFVMKVIEGGNWLLNSPVPLQGWSDEAKAKNQHMYDQSLRRIYNMYWRNSYTNPFWDIGMTMAFSGGEHLWNQYFPTGNTTHQVPAAMSNSAAGSNFFQADRSPASATAAAGGSYPTTSGYHPTTSGQQGFQSSFQPQPQPPDSQRARRQFRPPFSSNARAQRM